jgi:hypothetical protein
MPASEILNKFRAGTLHSGKGGPVVKNIHQARAIQLSYARKEGHNIPYKRKGGRGDSVPLSSLRRVKA